MPSLELTEFQLMIIERLQYGKEHAVSGKTLASLLGQKSDREIREQIRFLISLKWPILSSVSRTGGGYYLATTKEEVEAYAKDLHDRSMEILVRRRDLLRAARTINNPHQLNMVLKRA